MKATKAQVQARVEEVLAIRLDGAEFWHVREYAREKEREEGSAWHLDDGAKPLSDGQLWRYVGMADKLIAQSCRASRQKLLRRHLAQRRNIFGKAMSAGDYRAALAAAESEARLEGLFDTPARAAKVGPIQTPQDVLQLIATALADLRGGRLDSRTATAVGALAGNWLRAAEVADFARQLNGLRQQLEEISRVRGSLEEAGGAARGPGDVPGADEGDGPAGPAAAGPLPDDGPDGDGAGPLAGRVPPLFG